MIRGNDWSALSTEPLPPELLRPVSVIIPAKTTQRDLDLCLSALARQTYPLELLDVVVVDHRSDTPLKANLPDDAPLRVSVHRLESGDGPGAARAHGAELAVAEVLLFLDADIVAGPDLVYNYARWVLQDRAVLALGHREFLLDSTPVEKLSDAVASGDFTELLQTWAAPEGQEWIGRFLDRAEGGLATRDDYWAIVVGAGICVHRDLYQQCGGFRDYPIHGVEDIEFGYRAVNSGAVVISDSHAVGYHLGMRRISQERAATDRARMPMLWNLIAHRAYRDLHLGRRWTVPYLHIEVTASAQDSMETIAKTCNSLLANTLTDLHITLRLGDDHPDQALLERLYAAETCITLDTAADSARTVPVSSPLALFTRAGVVFGADALGQITQSFNDLDLGRLRLVAGNETEAAEVLRTATFGRASLYVKDEVGLDFTDIFHHLGGDSVLGASQFGITSGQEAAK